MFNYCHINKYYLHLPPKTIGNIIAFYKQFKGITQHYQVFL